MQAKITKTRDTMTKDIERRQQQLTAVPAQAYEVFVKATPRDTGNARKKTRLRGETIEASYPYATRLDEGSSSQSPQGMTKPTEQFLQKTVNKIMKG